MREIDVTVEGAHYRKRQIGTQTEPVGRQRKRSAYVGSELSTERAQGHMEVVRGQGQGSIAVKS